MTKLTTARHPFWIPSRSGPYFHWLSGQLHPTPVWNYCARSCWEAFRTVTEMLPELTIFGFPLPDVSEEKAKEGRGKLDSIEGFAQFVAAGAFLDRYAVTHLMTFPKRFCESFGLAARARETSDRWIDEGPFIAAAVARGYRMRPSKRGGANFNIGFGQKIFCSRLSRLPVTLDGKPLANWVSKECLQ